MTWLLRMGYNRLQTSANFDTPRCPTVFSTQELEVYLGDRANLAIHSEKILEYLDPNAHHDNILQLDPFSDTAEGIQYNYDDITSPLFQEDPLRWSFLVRLAYYHKHNVIKGVSIKIDRKSKPAILPLKLAGNKVNRYAFVKGIVKKVSTTTSATIYSEYLCRYCRNVNSLCQLWYAKLKKVNCVCGSADVIELPEKRIVETWQSLIIYPSDSSEYAHSLRLRVKRDKDYDLFVPGDEVLGHGYLRMVLKDNAIGEVYLDVEELVNADSKKRKITAKDTRIYNQFLIDNDKEYWSALRQQFFPGIYGLEDCKDAIMLQLFGGKMTKGRDTTHILIVGNPSSGKSALLKAIHSLTGGIFTSGMGATSAGLTATVYKDEVGTWCLDGGALVTSKFKTCCFDEIDKAHVSVLHSLLEAMEQQTVSITKAGINLTLPAKCRILAACNPKVGSRFDPEESFIDQIGLTAPLLSRFDIIIPVAENPEGVEKNIMRRLLNDKEDEQINNRRTLGVYLNSYLEYAQSIEPIMDNELKKEISEYYTQLKKRYRSLQKLPLSIRQLEGFVRLVLARARSRLSTTATLEDWKFVKDLLKRCYRALTGQLATEGDQEIILPNDFADHRGSKVEKAIKKIRVILSKSKDPISVDLLFLKISELDPTVTRKAYDSGVIMLKNTGELYQPDGQRLALVN